MLKQFEKATANKRVTDLTTSYVWTAAVAEWSMPATYDLGPCDSSNALTNGKCGPVLSAACTGSWVENTNNLKLKADGGVCQEGTWVAGIDASAVADTTKSYCPVLAFETEAQFATCLSLVFSTNLLAPLSPGLALAEDDVTPELPIKYSRASGSSLYMYDLFDAEAYVEAIEETRKGCDEDAKGPHCWMSGVAFDYWEQYLTIEAWMLQLCAIVCAISFAAASAFFFANFRQLAPSVTGGAVVALTSAATLLTVTGFSSLSQVKLCGFSAMACIMSAGFAVEYSVHVVHRFMELQPTSSNLNNTDPLERVLKAMDGLFIPTTMAFLASTVGILFLLGSDFTFVRMYFFTPLITVLFVTYFFGVFSLPVLFVHLGHLPFFQVQGSDDLGLAGGGGDGGGKGTERGAALSTMSSTGRPQSPPVLIHVRSSHKEKEEESSGVKQEGYVPH
jgi:hypothetical protein